MQCLNYLASRSSSRPEIANIRPVQKTSDQGRAMSHCRALQPPVADGKVVDTYGLFLSFKGDVCSQEAVVTSQSSKPEKQTAIIIAEEKGIMLVNFLKF